MKKLNYSLVLAICSLCFFVNCGSDDTSDTIEPTNNLQQEREATTTILTSSNDGVWKISEATLENSAGTFSVTTNFNVVDDEFIFSGTAQAGTLQWRQGNAINIEATTSQETLLDYYKSPENYTSSFVENSSNELTSLDGRFALTVMNAGTINGVVTFSNGEKLNVTLSPKIPGDYMSAPTSALNFTEVFVYESNAVSCCAPGMIGSYSDNSLFIVNKEWDLGINDIYPERIVKYNIDTGTTEENLYYNDDFVSKQLHIINNELVVIGGQYVNTYPLDFASGPQTTAHGLSITRFGMAIQDDSAFIIGGDLNNDPNTNLPINADKIYSWDLNTQSLSNIASMPAPRFGARSTIVNDKLYIFGGTTTFAPPFDDASDSIFIYDINSELLTTESMPNTADYTFVDKVQNLIYVSGYRNIWDISGGSYDIEFSLDVYDTQTGTYQELQHNLSNQGFNSIRGMCIFNGKLYVMFGVFDDELPNTAQWQIMAADLN